MKNLYLFFILGSLTLIAQTGIPIPDTSQPYLSSFIDIDNNGNTKPTSTDLQSHVQINMHASVYAINKPIKNGKVELTIHRDTDDLELFYNAFGFTQTDKRPITGYTSLSDGRSIDFGIKFWDSNSSYGTNHFYPYDNKTQYNDFKEKYNEGDVFAVEIKNNTVTYFRNNEIITTSNIKTNSDKEYALHFTYGPKYTGSNMPTDIKLYNYDDNSEYTLESNLNQPYYSNYLTIKEGKTRVWQDTGYGTVASLDYKEGFDEGKVSFKPHGNAITNYIGLSTASFKKGFSTAGNNKGFIYGFYFAKMRYGQKGGTVHIIENGKVISDILIGNDIYYNHDNSETFSVELKNGTIYYYRSTQTEPIYVAENVMNDQPENTQFRLKILGNDTNTNVDGSINVFDSYIYDIKIEDPSKQDFEVKTIPTHYSVEKEEHFTEIRDNLIDSNGNICDISECDTRNNIITKIANQEIFYHEGIDGDNSYFDNFTTEHESIVLNGELSTISFLIKNNTNKTQTYSIDNINLPSDIEDIFVRREIYTDNPVNIGSTGPQNIEYIGKAAPILSFNNNNGSESWSVKAYPNEIVKIIVEFIGNGDERNNYSLNVSNNNGENLPINLNITSLSNTIPSTHLSSIIFSRNDLLTRDNDKYPLTTRHYYSVLFDQIQSDIRVVYEPIQFTLDQNNKPIANLNGILNRMLGFIEDPNKKIALHWNGSNIPVNLTKQEKQAFYIDVVNQVYNLLKNQYVPNLKREQILLFPADELTINNTEYLMYYEAIGKSEFQSLVTLDSGATNDLVDLLYSYKIDHICTYNSEVINYIKENEYKIKLSIYAPKVFESSSIGYRNQGLKAALDGYNSYTHFPFNTEGTDLIGNDEDGNNGNTGVLYHFNKNGTTNPIQQHWFPAAFDLVQKKRSLSYQGYKTILGTNVFNIAESNLDGKIVSYLKSLNNPEIDNQLVNLKKILNDDNSKSKEISNTLKLLYSKNSNSYENIEIKNVIEEDASVRGTSLKDRNFNTETLVAIHFTDKPGSSESFRALIRLNLSDIKEDDTDINLVLTNLTGSKYNQLKIYPALSNIDWDETKITHNIALGTGLIDFYNNSEVIVNNNYSSFYCSGIEGETCEADITQFVLNAINNDDNFINLIITSNTHGPKGSIFASKDHTNENYRPYLKSSSRTNNTSARKVEKSAVKEIPTFDKSVSFTIVYPNPTAGEINVKAEKDIKAWKLVSMSGKTINHGQFNAPKKDFTSNIGNQSSGLYNIQIIYTDGTSESKKISKK